MTKYRTFLLRFPFDDLSSSKLRPALCLTDPIGDLRHVVLAPITHRKLLNPLPSDLFLDSGMEDFGEMGLRGSSTIQLHRLVTLRTTMIRKELGRLPFRLEQQVRSRLQQLLLG